MAEANENHLKTELREQFGKGAARRIRSAGKIPAVLYGHGTEPQHVTLPGHETALILRKSNQVLELDIQGGKTTLALVKDVQKDPVRQLIEHIDLVIVRKGEKVHVDVPIHILGEPAPGTALEQEAHTLLVEASALNIPESLQLSVEGIEAGNHLYASDITLPSDATLLADPETLIVSVVVPTIAAEVEEAAEAAAAAEAGVDVEAEGEEPAETEDAE
jgi:large subunit ribosomal protein L25